MSIEDIVLEEGRIMPEFIINLAITMGEFILFIGKTANLRRKLSI